ncbi:hypothetical protein [Falsiroseomonas sp. E2-1-a4]|uniref:hypothetical protein n=1 Tax=Falsiroseomonas sp. E2-1-a4 TaxID=3239299 RepID=UPI003F3A9F49
MTQNDDDDYDWPLISTTCRGRFEAGQDHLRHGPRGLPAKPLAAGRPITAKEEAVLAAALRQVHIPTREAPGGDPLMDEAAVLRWWLAGAGIDPNQAGVGQAFLGLLATCAAANLPIGDQRIPFLTYTERLAVALALFRVIRRSKHRHALIDVIRGASRKPPVRSSQVALSICLGSVLGKAPRGWTGVGDELFAEVNLLAANFMADWSMEEALGAGGLGESPVKLAACQWVWQWQQSRLKRARAALRDPRNAEFLIDLFAWLPDSDSEVLISRRDSFIALDRTDMGVQLVDTGPFSKLWGPSLEVPMTSEGPMLLLPKVGTRARPKGPGSRLLIDGYRPG